MIDTGSQFFSLSDIIAIALALVPSIIAWIRLGPRIDRMERTQDAQATELRSTSLCLTRLTTLQEVAERRMEHLEQQS